MLLFTPAARVRDPLHYYRMDPILRGQRREVGLWGRGVMLAQAEEPSDHWGHAAAGTLLLAMRVAVQLTAHAARMEGVTGRNVH